MTRVTLTDPANATGETAGPITEIRNAFGMVPNMFKAVAASPAALASMWGSFGALGGGRLGAKLGEQIAVAIADRNNCHYCLAAHTGLGRKAGATSEEMAEAQAGRSSDPRTAAALAFAVKLVDLRGHVSQADVDALRQHGFDDGEIVEILAHIALNLFTNYVNVALDVPVDFPGVKLTRSAA
ncbi:carboxymuconolactone decarboxylase family protein [Rhizobium sp. SSA_523]|uniref:carboxymuconolactone decarboxylase family protein n=1 Tax=Rhizobium sp. SSA_523 TaxID=2952477 RepID=UPI00209167B1|nr:carboxymuconolactone decarboxylase family protein [Rhizobium sp. SSA_523]MCO5731485.1 carboxymuconolactone decarboxylase family protein [Rhizobium sp. SSA_523]WKC21996.1 carboxymuconolactone decarboxylase family protein [Rhizobium sp. SSA_523]